MSRLGEDDGVARHDGHGQLYVDIWGVGAGHRWDLAREAFRRYFRESDGAVIRMRSRGPDPQDPQVERFDYLGAGP